MAKIARFQLNHLVESIGWEGYGYKTELLLGQKKIADVDDYADGPLHGDITWYGSLKDEMILKTTMEKIVNNADSDLLSCDTINHCVEYMVELLIELQDVEKQGKKFFASYRPNQSNVYIGIYSAWMSSEESDKSNIPCPGMINNKTITKEQAETLIKKKNGKPLGLVEMHMGKDLNLSLDEYIGIFKPYLNTQEPGMNGIDGTR